MSEDAVSLYDRDFFSWTQAQAQALRAQGRGSNSVDWENVAEEIESMGRSELHTLESLVVRIIQHLHYLRATRAMQPVAGWRREIGGWRRQIRKRTTTTLRNKLEAELPGLLAEGASEAERWARIDQAFFDEIDVEHGWTLAQILGEEDDPLAEMTGG